MLTRRRRSLPDQVVDSVNKEDIPLPRVEFISTGSIPLNLAASQKGRHGGWARGRIINIVGDGSTGKTLLALETAAHAFHHIKSIKSVLFPEVKRIQIVYNNVEGVMDFPIEEMYGQDFVDGVEWIQSETCQHFGRDYQRRVQGLSAGCFLLYIADSIDAMISQEAKDRIEKSIKQDKEEDGSYGTEKAKYFSQSFFNNLCSIMKGKDATLILISQVRENLNSGTFGKKFYRTGGKALDFFTHQVVWLYKMGALKREFKGHEVTYGVKIKCKFERNKVAKPFREMDLPIIFDYGVDDIRAMLNYLGTTAIKEIEAKINEAETNPDYYDSLINEMEGEWSIIENHVTTKRRKKYATD